MKINLNKLLQFYDNPLERGHASAITGILGEDLCAAAFAHYWETRGKGRANILDERVNTGHLRGHRLDRWIEVNSGKTYFQCEIKNWAATAFGGLKLEVNAKSNFVKKISQANWKRQLRVSFSNRSNPNYGKKVLLEMRPLGIFTPKTHIEPLMIYWMPISNNNTTEPFFTIPISSLGNRKIKTRFKKLHVFSASLYFRELYERNASVNLHLPNAEKRMTFLRQILKVN